jgi:bacterioferritin-associated ferredoxin
MDINALIEDLSSKHDGIRKTALDELMAITENRVEWVYEYLDIFKSKLQSENSYQRNIGAMLLANLAKSDTQGRLTDVMEAIIRQMDDEKFITARITLQHAWKFAEACGPCARAIAAGLVETLKNNRHLKTHGNLIRLDAITSINRILKLCPDAVNEQAVREIIRETCDAKEAMHLMAILDTDL